MKKSAEELYKELTEIRISMAFGVVLPEDKKRIQEIKEQLEAQAIK